MESYTDCHQCDEQVRTLQFPFYLQRDALLDSARANGSTRLPLLNPIVPDSNVRSACFKGTQAKFREVFLLGLCVCVNVLPMALIRSNSVAPLCFATVTLGGMAFSTAAALTVLPVLVARMKNDRFANLFIACVLILTMLNYMTTAVVNAMWGRAHEVSRPLEHRSTWSARSFLDTSHGARRDHKCHRGAGI